MAFMPGVVLVAVEILVVSRKAQSSERIEHASAAQVTTFIISYPVWIVLPRS